MPSWRKVITSGSDANLRSLVVSQSVNAESFTGSLQGKALSAEVVVINSDTAPTSSLSGSLWYNTDNLTLYVRYTDPSGSTYWVPSYNDGIPLTSSYSITSSYVVTAQTASYVVTSLTASVASTVDVSLFNSDIDSFVVLSNVSGRSGVGIGAGNNLKYNANKDRVTVGTVSATSLTGSLLGTATAAINADTASYVETALTASYYNLPVTYSQAFTASFINLARTASFVATAQTASYVVTALTASYVATAQTASRVLAANVIGTVSSANTASFVSSLSQRVIVSGSVEATTGITASQLILTDNGNSTNLRIGDDVWIGDINTANTFGIRGMYNTGSGFIRFGNAGTSPILGANNGSATMELSGSIAITGQIIQPTKVAFSVYGSGTTNSLTTTQNGDGTLNTNNFTIEFNQGSYLTGSTGIFTAPLPGLYQANLIARNSGYSSGISQIAIVKNNSNTGGNIAMMEFAASSTMNHAGVSKVFYMAAGDTLRIKVLAGQITFDVNDSWSVVYLG